MFKISEEQLKLINEWLKEQDLEAVEIQKWQFEEHPEFTPSEMYLSSWEVGYPYGGATGGIVTYSFTPTSLGVVVKVRHAITGNILDVTDYDNW